MTGTPRVLIAFHTEDGQTAKIADRIAGGLTASGLSAALVDVDASTSVDGYDAVVVGDSIRVGHHSKALRRFLDEQSAALDTLPTALFQVSLTSTNPDDEHTATAHGLVQELLDRTGFAPDIVGMFAGALVYTRYGWFTRHVMRSIAKHEGADTDTSRDFEYTDWDAVDAFAADVATLTRRSV